MLLRPSESDRDLRIFRRTWRSLIQLYTSSDLTIGNDKLYAFAALVDIAQEGTQMHNFSGLWLEILPTELTWKRAGKTPSSGFPRSKDQRAPSWSWAKEDSPVEFIHDYAMVLKVDACEICHGPSPKYYITNFAHFTSPGLSTTLFVAQLPHGLISLMGPIVECRSFQSSSADYKDDGTNWLQFQDEDLRFKFTADSDLDEKWKESSLFILGVSQYDNSWNRNELMDTSMPIVVGLVLVKNKTGTYKRVGVFEETRPDLRMLELFLDQRRYSEIFIE